jgi:hypothetical protein
MNIQDLPIEIQNKIFYYYAEHPCARMIKEVYNYKLFKVVDYDVDECFLVLRSVTYCWRQARA